MQLSSVQLDAALLLGPSFTFSWILSFLRCVYFKEMLWMAACTKRFYLFVFNILAFMK